MIKLYEVVSNFYLAGQKGQALECYLPTRYHGLYLTKRGAIKKLNKIIKDLEAADLHDRFKGAHEYMAIFPLDVDGFVIQNWPEDKEKLYSWVRYHISVHDLMKKDYLEELQ